MHLTAQLKSLQEDQDQRREVLLIKVTANSELHYL